METKPRRRLRRLLGTLAWALIALAIGLGPVGYADINIDTSNFKIPGFSAAEPREPGQEPQADARGKAFGDLAYRIGF